MVNFLMVYYGSTLELTLWAGAGKRGHKRDERACVRKHLSRVWNQQVVDNIGKDNQSRENSIFKSRNS